MSRYTVSGTTMDHGDVEQTFEGEEALLRASLYAQGIEEDGGSAYVTNDEDDTVVDHWEGYRVALVPMGDSVGIALGHNIINGR